jgi:DNA-binding protein HU-beta
MNDRIDEKELASRVAQRLQQDTSQTQVVVEATLEEIYQALKAGQRVSLPNLGAFYVKPQEGSWVFKFNPAQRLRKLFGWSSTYKGEL